MTSEVHSLARLLQKLKPIGERIALGEADCEELWSLRRAFSQSLKATGLTKLNEDIVVPRGKLTDLAAFAARLRKKYGYPIAPVRGRAGGIRAHLMIGHDVSSIAPPARSYPDQLRTAGVEVHTVGKVGQLFAGRGVDAEHPGADNARAIAQTGS